MPLYRYHALTPNGEIQQGYISGLSKQEVLIKLSNRKLDPLSIFRKGLLGSYFTKTPTSAELQQFFLYLEYALKAGVPLTQAIYGIIPSFQGNFQAILLSLYEEISAGKLFSVACGTYSFLFPPVIQALLQLGENSGRLSHMCTYSREYLKKQQEQKKHLTKALRYPLISLCAFLGASYFFVSFFLPELLDFLVSCDLSPPFSTRLLLALLNFPYRIFFLCIGAISIPLAGCYLWFYPASRLFLGKLSYKILPGSQLRAQFHYVKFLQALALLCTEHVGLLKSLSIAQRSLSSFYLEKSLEKARKCVEGGAHLCQAFKGLASFNPFYLQLIQMGEVTGKLAQALDYTYQLAYQDLIGKIEKWITWIEPVLLLLISFLLIFLISATLLPFYDQLGNINYG